MKNLEYFGKWYDGLLNSWPFLLDTDAIKSQGMALGFKEDGAWKFKPRLTGNGAMYYNALFFVRLSLPFGVFLHFRLTCKRLLQVGLGWKLNGRIAVHCRFQTDASAAQGYHEGLPNNGQAQCFDYGPH